MQRPDQPRKPRPSRRHLRLQGISEAAFHSRLFALELETFTQTRAASCVSNSQGFAKTAVNLILQKEKGSRKSMTLQKWFEACHVPSNIWWLVNPLDFGFLRMWHMENRLKILGFQREI